MNTAVPPDIPGAEPACPIDQSEVRRRLAGATVGIVGCGGLGSNAALMLVRSGVGGLVLCDHDTVEESNLNRQMYFPDQLGRPKVEALAETLRRLAPEVRLTTYDTCALRDNLVERYACVDVLIEAVDTAEAKEMLANAVPELLPEIPFVWAMGLAGCASANAISTMRVGEDAWVVGDLEADVRDGLPLLASRVMVAAAHEAHMATRILLGMPEA